MSYSALRNESIDFVVLAKGLFEAYASIIYIRIYPHIYRRNGPDFGRVFLRSYYTDITQNTYIQSSTVTEILAREV